MRLEVKRNMNSIESDEAGELKFCEQEGLLRENEFFQDEERVYIEMDNNFSKPSKRNREVDAEEVWTTVQRKDKRFALTGKSSARYQRDSEEQRIEVCIVSKEPLPKQFKLAKLLRSEKILNVVRVKYLNSYKVLIQFDKEESAEELMKCKYFNEMGYNCYKTMEMNHIYGVIKDIDLDRTDEEILESLFSNIKILGIKRLKRKNSYDGRWETSEAMRICFEGSSLPTHIKMFDTSVKVTPYIYPVTQCSRCWRFGHINKFCPSYKTICPKCGENHENCERTSFYCNNCRGDHMAMAKICPIYIKEKRIRELMAEFCCTYKKALTIYVPPSPPPVPIMTEKCFPHLNNNQSSNTPLEDDATVDEVHILSKSYAEVTTAKHKKIKAKSVNNKNNLNNSGKQNKKTTKQHKNIENVELLSESGSNEKEKIVYEFEQEDEINDNQNSEKWKILFEKLKIRILDTSLTWEEKVNGCTKILHKFAITFIMKFIMNWSCFKLNTQNGSTD